VNIFGETYTHRELAIILTMAVTGFMLTTWLVKHYGGN